MEAPEPTSEKEAPTVDRLTRVYMKWMKIVPQEELRITLNVAIIVALYYLADWFWPK